MTIEIPQYGLKAYALLFSKHGTQENFRQSELDWIVSTSMKKKIFSLLLRTGWIKKNYEGTYSCINPSDAIKGLLEFRVPEIMKHADKKYAFTQLSAVEIWSDFSYVQRGWEKSSPWANAVPLHRDADQELQEAQGRNVPGILAGLYGRTGKRNGRRFYRWGPAQFCGC